MDVTLDLSGCTGQGEIWARLLAALGAPDWHGANLDALWDGLAGELFPRPGRIVVTGRGDPEAEGEWARILPVLAEAGVAVRRARPRGEGGAPAR